MIRCPNCQTENPEGKKFCRECGEQIRPKTQDPKPAPDSIRGPKVSPESRVSSSQSTDPLIHRSTNPQSPARKRRWWIWLVVVVALAAAAYFIFFSGGMGGFELPKFSKSSSVKKNAEQELAEGLIASFQNDDPSWFLDEFCLTRSDLYELNQLMPAEEKFDEKEASEGFGRTEGRLLDQWRVAYERSQEESWNWNTTVVLSCEPMPSEDNKKIHRGITVLIESGGRQAELFLESCAYLNGKWKVCQEIEWAGIKSESSNTLTNTGTPEEELEKRIEQGSETEENQTIELASQSNAVQVEKDDSQRTDLPETDDGRTSLVSSQGYNFRYEGDMRGGKANGQGKGEYPSFSYEGSYKDNEMHGQGKQVFLDGVSFTGSFENGLRHGQGTIRWADGAFYTGDWLSGNRTGQGTYTWADGGVFVGQWLDGQRTNGRMTFASKDIYEGEYQNDIFQGQGSYFWVDGNRYVGQYDQGNRHGKGTFYWKDGQRYEGDFVKNIRTGEGTYYWPDGGSFTGQFENNERIKGLMKYGSGGSYEGNFEKGIRSGFGIYRWPSGSEYSGNWINGDRVGFGTMIYSDKTKYEGYWVNDKREGNGTYWYIDGSYYKGGFKDDLFHGQGTKYNANGQVVESGTWEKGNKT